MKQRIVRALTVAFVAWVAALQAQARDIELNFPAESMGTLCGYPIKSAFHGVAKGKVKVPSGIPLELTTSYYGSNHLDMLCSLPPGAVVFTSLFNLEIDDEKFCRLKNVKGLKYIATNESEITDKSLIALADMTALKALWVSNSRINGRGLASMKNVASLEDLNISSNELVLDALVNLKNFSRIKRLLLVQTGLTNKALSYLKPLSELTQLDLSRNPGITDDGMANLTELQHLKILDISHTKVTAKSLKYLKQFKALQLLTLSLSNMPPADREAFRKGLPKCILNDVTSLNRNNIPNEVFAPLH